MTHPRKFRGCRSCALAVIALAPLFVGAATTFYNDKATFLAAAGSLSLESFESYTATNSLGFSSYSTTFGTMTTPNTSIGIFDAPTGAGGVATDGSQFLINSGDGDALTFNFTNPIKAFGVYVIDTGEAPVGDTVAFNNVGDSTTIASAPLANGTILFFGVINTTQSFTQVVIDDQSTDTGMAVDEVYYSVPEPAAYHALGLAMLIVALARRPVR